MKKVLTILDSLVIIMGVLIIVFYFMYTNLCDSIYRDLLVGAVWLGWASLGLGDHIRRKSESERLKKFLRKNKY